MVFLFDVDNTLLDNDQVQRDLSDHLAGEFGNEARERYWALFEDLRATLGYADYLGTLPARGATQPQNAEHCQLACRLPVCRPPGRKEFS